MTDFTTTTDIYSQQGNARLRIHVLRFPVLRRFSTSVSHLTRDLVDADTPAATLLSRLKAVRFILASSPLAPQDLDAIMGSRLVRGELSALAASAYAAYPSARSTIELCLYELDGLLAERSNPGRAVMDALTEPGTPLTVVVPGQDILRMCDEAVQRGLLRRNAVRFTVAEGIRRGGALKQLVVFGALSWYPAYLVSSPRAGTTNLIRFNWIHDDIPEPSQWTLPGARDIASGAVVEHAPTEIGNEEPEWIGAADLVPGISSSPDVRVPARACAIRVEGGLVYVPVERGRAATVVEILHDGKPSLHRESTEGLEPGMFIVVRTEGSADYVTEVANRLLGGRASILRAVQARWTGALRDQVDKYGVNQTARMLMERGGVRASQENVRRWAYGRTISPDSAADLGAIVELCGIGPTAEYVAQLRDLAFAHLRAGMVIRRELERQVLGADTSELLRVGRAEFRIEGGGALVALRIDDVGPSVVEVDEDALLVLYERRL